MKNIVLTLMFFSTQLCFSQRGMTQANHYYSQMDYPNAIKSYLQIAEKNENVSQTLWLNLAESYFKTNAYSSAVPWYQKIYNVRLNEMEESYFLRFITCLRANNAYDESLQLVKSYYKDNKEVLEWYVSENQLFDSVSAAKEVYTIKNLDVNTPFSDFGAVFYNSKMIFSSTRDSSTFKTGLYAWNHQPYLKLYEAELNRTSGELTNVKNFFPNETLNFHKATVAFSSDYKYIFYTRNVIQKKNMPSTNEEGMSNLQIVRGTLENEKIVKEEILGFNSMNYSCGQPVLSEDGKLLFFVSNMPGSYGETDIYMVEIDENGGVGAPINLGPKVNTKGREMFPFYKNNVLYFSSDTHLGYGGLDIYRVAMRGKQSFGTPVNMGGQINSSFDDFAFVLQDDQRSGYFSSSRHGGKGDDDLYYFKTAPVELVQNFAGVVFDEKSKQIIPHVKVEVYDLFGELMSETVGNEKGEFSVQLPLNYEQKCVFSMDGYGTKRLTVKTETDPNEKMEKNEVFLSKFEDVVTTEEGITKIIVNPIYFDLMKWNINESAQFELKKVLRVMNEFPDIVIRIESHTDARGSDRNNLELSDNRAKATMNFLIEKGIEPSRIESAIGYGEFRLKNRCSNGENCTEEEHAVNRRSDFIIVNRENKITAK